MCRLGCKPLSSQIGYTFHFFTVYHIFNVEFRQFFGTLCEPLYLIFVNGTKLRQFESKRFNLSPFKRLYKINIKCMTFWYDFKGGKDER